jgi:hypothetical protein
MRFANFPAPWRLEDFDFTAQPSIDEPLIRDLATCRYTEDATNIMLIGPPGVGKTHLAIGLGHKAAEAGYRTYYTTAADLAARCRKAAIEGRWANTMRFFKGPTVLIIDELGYLPMPAEDANALSTEASLTGATSSPTPPSQQPSSTGSSTAASQSPSTATATGSAPTKPAPKPSPNEHPTSLHPPGRVRNIAEQHWGISVSGSTRGSQTTQPGACWSQVTPTGGPHRLDRQRMRP